MTILQFVAARTAKNDQPVNYPAFTRMRRTRQIGEFPRDYWAVKGTGNWTRDLETGRGYAHDAIRFMREEGTSAVLGWIVLEMVRKEQFGAVEVGFFDELGSLILQAGR